MIKIIIGINLSSKKIKKIIKFIEKNETIKIIDKKIKVIKKILLKDFFIKLFLVIRHILKIQIVNIINLKEMTSTPNK